MIFKYLSYFCFINFLQMKKLYFLFFLIIGFFGNAQIVNIPDANFKAKLLAANNSIDIASNFTQVNTNYTVSQPNGYCKIDLNNDGEIQITEASNIQFLNIYNSNISNLSGIEYFSNLKVLHCNNNPIVSHNLTNLLNLQILEVSSNQTLSLDLSGLSSLKYLSCVNNSMNNLTLTGCTSLEKLLCYNNQLINLNFSNLTNLQYLDCDNNQISNLDLNNLINLSILRCNYNLITNINIENCTSLTGIGLFGNLLSELDVSDCHDLQQLICSGNNLIKLNIKNGSVIDNSVFLNYSNNPNLSYICVDENEISIINSQNSDYNLTNCQVNSYCSFTPGGIFYTVQGNSKFDSNNNGCDVSDLNYSNLNFSITDGTYSGSLISNSSGNYYIPVQSGNHTITPSLENPSYFNISPTSFTVDFPTQASPFTQDFCVTANGVHRDIEIVLVPTVPARPGFDASYKLIYRNKGNQVENGTISLTFDDAKLDYVSSNPVYNSTAVNNFTWNYTNLQPFETREIGIVFNANSPMETPAVINGDVLNYTAIITTTNTDEMPTDNTFTLDQTVVGSYDPNDKTCLQGTTIIPSEVGKYVHYVIRFENTGTYPAENIVVKDIINTSKFDITTLVPLKSSHDFYTRINGNKVEFIFENINLDFNDATNDGYVTFKIKTKPTLIVGNTFTNNANIYFDYNFPITTNTYTTTVAALSTQDFDFGTYFTLYPNPAKEVLNIESKQDVNINSVEIYNQLGQIVMATTNAINTIDLADLASGAYFVKVNTEKGSANTKFVKE